MPDVSWCIKGGSRGYVTTRPLEWPIGKKESGWRLTVATGREFESSVPELKYKKRWLQSLLGWFQPFTWLMRPDDPFFLKSACIHDVLLEDGYRVAFADSQWFEAALPTKLTRLNLGLPIWRCACATSGGSRKSAPDYSAQGPRWDLGRIGWSPNGS